MKTLFVLLICWGSIILSPNDGFAQRDQKWLDKNDRGNRFEGTYSEPNGAPPVEIISFYGSFESYEFNQNQTLNVSFYSPEPSDFFLKAEELTINAFYWMQNKQTEAKKGWNSFSGWKVDNWLGRHKINRANLGVVISLGKPEEKMFSPAFIFRQKKPANSPFYTFLVRLGRDVAFGECRIYEGLYQGISPDEATLIQETKVGKRKKNTHFPVRIPMDQLSSSGKWYTLKMSFKQDRSTKTFGYTCYFFHPGNL